MIRSAPSYAFIFVLVLSTTAGCGGRRRDRSSPRADAGVGVDASVRDGGDVDAGGPFDGGTMLDGGGADGGAMIDAGGFDAGIDGGPRDAGTDGGTPRRDGGPRTGRVLVFTAGSGGAATTAADEAATRLGLTAEVIDDGTSFGARFDAGGFDLLVVDSASDNLEVDATSRIVSWIGGGNPIIFAHWDLDAESTLRAALEVATVSFTTIREVHRPTTPAIDLFNYSEIVPTPLVGMDTVSDDGDALTPTGTGSVVLGRFDRPDGDIAILLTRGGTAIVNGFMPYDFLSQDADRDGVIDMVELYVNEMALVLD